MNQKLLVLSALWIEPKSSAAGYRMKQILELFQSLGYDIHYASTSKESAAVYSEGMELHNILLNDVSFDSFLAELKPDAVLYDRFMLEEQFGWRVREVFPDILQILDTEDLHFLRKSRQKVVLNKGLLSEDVLGGDFLKTEEAKREIGAILRCDLTIMISKVEVLLLKDEFNISADQLIYLPFLSDSIIDEAAPFDQRKDFMSIGNMFHPPNRDSVFELKKTWMQIRKLTGANLYIYGAYSNDEILRMNNPSNGFYVKGWAENVDTVMQEHRVLLAPLRFGAGLKGKLFDAMRNNLPSITTWIGAEGMIEEGQQWPGEITSSPEEFIQKASLMYNSESLWNSSSSQCRSILETNFSKESADEFLTKVPALQRNLKSHRKRFFLGEILKSDLQAKHKYLSKYIEIKNSKN
jgi:glycosyltransferase involved in cell wall biosynthesis